MKSINLSTIDGIIFDMDGVLVDVNASYREAIRQTASYFLKREVNIDEVDTVKAIVGMNNDWDATYALINNVNISYEQVKKYFQLVYLGADSSAGLISNEKLLVSKKQLIELKNKYKKLGIATGRPKHEAEYVLEKNKLQDIFNCLVAMEDVENGKPSPDPINKIIEILSLKNTIYVGDSPSDVVASQSAGIPCIYVGNQKIGNMRFATMLQVIYYLL